jgi:very-short-patch-repair endonuclease
LGLHFRFIEDGIYHRGNERTNPIEAGCVADAVIRHAEKYPKKSLGVGTFSVAQRDEILNQIELRRRKLPHLERFFARGDVEPFFVKNLETIQGDQRDVIFISVGFAKDHEGHMSMSFGPLSTEGGERRLNVLISRAKERMEVFSSITADDIVLERTKFIGPRVLKKFLTYAKSGHLDVPIPSDRPSNVLELEIARSLTARGYKVEEQVGTAGFFVDLAIVDPDRPGRYILGIEFDGATYHSSRSRRDADITRQDVLEARGWTIHRIWSTDWFNDPDAELNQVVQAVEQAQDKCTSSTEVEGAGDYGEGEPGKDELGVGIEDGVQDTLDERAGIDGSTSTPIDEGAIPYEEARFLVRSPGGPAGASDGQIEDAVLRIVECEGPIHQEEIARRLAHVFGKKRAGQVIQGKALKATQKLRRNVLFGKANFFDLPERVVRVRDRSDPKYQSVRNSKMLPPTEIQQAVREFLTDCFGASLNECTKGVAGLFGFQAVSSDLRKIIGKEIRSMLSSEALLDRDGALYLNEK